MTIRTRTVVTVNKAQCRKCGDVIESKHVHDFRSCKCGAIMVDGGLDYIRRVGQLDQIIELSETHEEEYEANW